MVRLLLPIFLALMTGLVSAQQVTYKGLAFGATMDEFKERFPDHQCWANKCAYASFACKAGYDTCAERNSFGGVHLKSAHSEFRDGKLVAIRMMFSTGDFYSLAGALKERLGEPQAVVESKVQTRAGVKLDNQELKWDKNGALLSISRYGSTINEGSVTYITREEEQRQIAEWEAKKKAGAKDF